MNKICALIKETPASSPAPFHPVRTQRENGCLWTRGLIDTKSAHAFILDLSVSRTMRNKCLLSKLPNLWICIAASWKDKDNCCGLLMKSAIASGGRGAVLCTVNLLSALYLILQAHSHHSPLPDTPSSFSPLSFYLVLGSTRAPSVCATVSYFFLFLAHVTALLGIAFLSSSFFFFAWLPPAHFLTSTHISPFPGSVPDFFSLLWPLLWAGIN